MYPSLKDHDPPCYWPQQRWRRWLLYSAIPFFVVIGLWDRFVDELITPLRDRLSR